MINVVTAEKSKYWQYLVQKKTQKRESLNLKSTTDIYYIR